MELDWTDDMTISLPAERTVEEIGEFVIRHGVSGQSGGDMADLLIDAFHLSSDDAVLVCDRVLGGVVRAATGNVSNRPDPAKDPFAFYGYERGRLDHGIVAAIFPEYAEVPKRPWWRFWG